MAIKNIIYDFDGTIVDTVDEITLIYNQIAFKRGYKQVTKDNIEGLKSRGVREFMKEMNIPRFIVPILLAEGRRMLTDRIPEINPHAGMPKLLAELHQRGFVQGLVSSNSLENLEAFLMVQKINQFEYVRSASLFGKAKNIRKMMREHSLLPEETLYVGDEIRDIEAARKAGVRVTAVTWGMNVKSALQDAKPDFIVDTPDELLAILTKQQ